MSGESVLDLLARDPHLQAFVTDAYTPDVVAHVRAFFDTWVTDASPEELEMLLQKWMKSIALPKENNTIKNNRGQYLPLRLIGTERIRPAQFLAGFKDSGFVELRDVLISSEYKHASFIFAETLADLGHWFTAVKVNPVRNPKGGKLFEPIGIATLLMSFSEGTVLQGYSPPFFVNFLVLDESPVERGAYAILGKPDIERVFGTTNLDLVFGTIAPF